MSSDPRATRVPRYTREYLENTAEQLLDWFDKGIRLIPQRTPLEAIAKRIAVEFGVPFIFDQDLGRSAVTGKKILGFCQLSPPAIWIDRAVVNTRRWGFTLAHEIGHLILHRNLHLAEDIDSPSQVIADQNRHMFFGRRILRTQRDWLEWHANKFAAALLLPKDCLFRAVVEKQRELDINSRVGLIFVDHQSCNIFAAREIVGSLMAVFQTSRTVLNIRLKELGILYDCRDFGGKHVSALLRAA